MSQPPPLPRKALALDDLIALADEMAALVRAGVPLESGLAQAAREMRPGQGRLASELARRMGEGESLPQILQSSPRTFPPLFRAVVLAGIKSGRLPVALEGLASNARRMVELRRFVRASLIYPVAVALLALGLMIAGLASFQPRLQEFYASMHAEPSTTNRWLALMGKDVFEWAPSLLVGAVAFGTLLWWLSRGDSLRGPWLVRMLPARRMLHLGRFATFSDTLALLVEHEVPLDEAVVLAGDACGDRAVASAASQFAAEVRRGAVVARNNAAANAGGEPSPARLPPLIAWLLASGSPSSALAHSLRTTAEAYRRQAMQLDDRLRLYLPLALTTLIGGTAAVVYAFSVLGPWYKALVDIST